MNTKTIKLLLALTVAALPVTGLLLAEKSPKPAAPDRERVARGKYLVTNGEGGFE